MLAFEFSLDSMVFIVGSVDLWAVKIIRAQDSAGVDTPQEFAPLHLWMAELLAILIVLLVTALILRVSLIAMGWLLIGHEKLFLSGADCSFRHTRDEQHNNRQNQPLMIFLT